MVGMIIFEVASHSSHSMTLWYDLSRLDFFPDPVRAMELTWTGCFSTLPSFLLINGPSSRNLLCKAQWNLSVPNVITAELLQGGGINCALSVSGWSLCLVTSSALWRLMPSPTVSCKDSAMLFPESQNHSTSWIGRNPKGSSGLSPDSKQGNVC